MGVGVTLIRDPLDSPDVRAMVKALRGFGVTIEESEEWIRIEGVCGKLSASQAPIDAGNSGQILRFVGALAALLPEKTVITGDQSIRERRPVEPLLSALRQLGAKAEAPMSVQGPIRAGFAELLGEDSQPVSALLIATSFLKGTTQLEVKNPGERPWIDLTLAWLERLGGVVTHEAYRFYTIEGPLLYKGFEVTIPGDFSTAAFPAAAALITGSTVTLENLDPFDSQGDKKLFEVFERMGAQLEYDVRAKSVTLFPSKLKGVRVDVNEMIDALPILAVVGCFASGKTEIVGGKIARKKESDRIAAIACELRKMGAILEEREDGLLITSSPLHSARLSSHSDHRIAMALAVAAKGATGTTWIEGAECVKKSYPRFFEEVQ